MGCGEINGWGGEEEGGGRGGGGRGGGVTKGGGGKHWIRRGRGRGQGEGEQGEGAWQVHELLGMAHVSLALYSVYV
jgi:hypothetical protein